MGEDIFQSMLYSFNGFPALPIFIGDFLLTQLQKYFFIPVMIMAVFLGYHYITKSNGGGFNQIAYRAVTSVGIIFGILQANIPMTQYINEVLKTQPTKPSADKDANYMPMDMAELSVFQDVNHYLIVGYMSSFISFSNVIANNLTRKIIYGKTEIMDIGHEGQSAKLMGYFPSLIYNVQKAQMKRDETRVKSANDYNKLEDFAKALKTSNAKLDGLVNELKTIGCQERISLALVDNQFSGDRRTGFSARWIYSPREGNSQGIDKVCSKMLSNNNLKQVADIKHHSISLPSLISYSLVESMKDSSNSKGIINDSPLLKGSTFTDVYASILKGTKAPNDGKPLGISQGNPAKEAIPDAVKALQVQAASYFSGGSDDVSVKVLTIFEKIYAEQVKKLDASIKSSGLTNLKSFSELIKVSQGGNASDQIDYLTRTFSKLRDRAEDVAKDNANKYSKEKGKDGQGSENLVTQITLAKYNEIMSQARQTAIAFIALSKYYDAVSKLQKNYTSNYKEFKVPNAIANAPSLNKATLERLIAVTGIEDSVAYLDFITADAARNYLAKDAGKNQKPFTDQIKMEYLRDIDSQKDEKKKNEKPAVTRLGTEIAESIERQWQARMYITGGAIAGLVNAMALASTPLDETNPFRQVITDYQAQLQETSLKYQEEAIRSMGSENGLEKIREVQGMFSVYNSMRPEGMMPIPGFVRPISWMDLGIFYTVFKTTYERTVRSAFVISQVGKQNMSVIERMNDINRYTSRERINEIVGGTGTIFAVSAGIVKGVGSYVNNSKGPDAESKKFFDKFFGGIGSGATTAVSFILGVIFIMFLINILLPTGVWFIALLTYYIEIAVYLSIAPIALILMIFQSYHGAVQKYINVLIMLLLYPSALVAMYFLVLFLDMMMPLLLFSFIPFFNDTNALGSSIEISLGNNFLSSATQSLVQLNDGGVGSVLSIIVICILTIIMSTYLIFMLLRVNNILAQCLQGGGFSMVDSNSGVGADTERKLKGLAQVGGVQGMIA